METKKTKLIKSLKVAINALKNDTIHYEWKNQESCNCGVVSQAILSKTRTEIKDSWTDLITELKKYDKIDKEIERTWKSAVKWLCPITGKSNIKILDELIEAGLSKSDIVHLEYMDNSAILQKSGIKTVENKIETEQVIKEKNVITNTKPHSNWLLAKFGKTIEEITENITYEDKIKEVKIEITDFYKNKENLILYLVAWVKILEEGIKYKEEELTELSVNELEGELLNAVAEENYEYATVLRDEINLR